MVTGSGTSADPYVLYNLSDLEQISVLGLNKYYELANDIDASATADPSYNGGAGWLPIGTSGSPFTGSFDGKGFEISGIYINRPTTNGIGFFGGTNTSNISNFVLSYFDITGQTEVGAFVGYKMGGDLSGVTVSNGEVNGVNHVGGVVGRNYRYSISNCVANAVDVVASGGIAGGILGFVRYYNLDLTYCDVVSCSITGTNGVGGIIGYCEAANAPLIINNCNVDADISGSGNVGGVVGYQMYYSTTTVIDGDGCTITGSITSTKNTVGGVTGYGSGKIQNFNIDSDFEFKNLSSINNVGGICGYVQNNVGLSVFDCLVETDITANDYVGGILGFATQHNSPFSISGSSYRGAITANSHVGGIVGFCLHSNNNYIDGEGCFVKGSITATGNNVGCVVGYGCGNIKNWVIGDGLTLNVSNSSNVGGVIGTIYLLSIKVENCSVTIDIDAVSNVGGILGYAQQRSVTDTFSICSYQGNITGVNNVGGIIGGLYHYSNCSMEYCFTTGSITSTGSYIGGLIGYNFMCNINNSFSQMDVSTSGSHIGGAIGRSRYDVAYVNCYSKGSVTGNSAGGFQGSIEADSPTATSCYWDTQTSGQSTSALGTGKTTTEMKTQSTFTDWDFETIWNIGTHFDGYPFLRAFPVLIYITIINSIDSLIEFGCGE